MADGPAASMTADGPAASASRPQVPWVNWSGSQLVFPKRVVRPKSVPELLEIVRDVTACSGRLKPVATGLSFSDILQADDTLLEVTGLLGEPDAGVLLPLENELWHVRTPPRPLVRVACGARIRFLNAALARAGLAFTNLGGYDGQTLIGAISTSTHGSGVGIPPLCDGVRSLDLITTAGQYYRIEPTRGLTDPEKFQHRYGATRKLVQSDAWFWSAVVSLGCMGVIHSVVMQVSPAYRLQERRSMRCWSDVTRDLRAGALSRVRNLEVLINPYPRKEGDYSCLYTERRVARPDLPRVPLPSDRQNAEKVAFLDSTQEALLELMTREPRLIPGVLESGLAALETGMKDHVEDAHLVYNVGNINTAHVFAGEYFFPLRDDLYLKAIAALQALVRDNAARGIYQPTPFAVRFVAGSRAPLSMARGEPHCTIEMSLFTESPHVGEALLAYEELCLAHGGRPHWGQTNELTGRPGWLANAYPQFKGTWYETYKVLNDRGLFNNHFTDRLGISVAQKAHG